MPFVILMTMMGIISLAGIVVNNSVVLIDFTQLLIARKKSELGIPFTERLSRLDVREVIIEGGVARLRPVILTAITTILGLLPLATGFNIDFFTLFTSWDPNIYFGGDKAKWIAAANTLKARFYLHQKDYPSALTAAQNGIGSASGDMRFIPGDAAQEDDNLFWMILEGSRGGDIGNDDGVTDSYLLELIDPANSSSRNNAKTDETARRGFYFVNPSSGSDNDGIIEKMQPQNMVTFFENKLIMAESAARGGTVASALPHLNQVRAWLNDGGNLNDNYLGQAHRYDPYVEADFNAGGIENADNITPTNAFLREVIEERYVSGFGMHMPYNDARRLRKSDGAIAVPYVMYNSDNTRKPERMPYATNELNSNSNAPSEDPGIFTKTQVNQ